MTSSEQLEQLLIGKEDEHTEFKVAKEGFSFENLLKYCVAFANERGGRLVLGVTDKPPRRVVGTQAFESVDKVKGELLDHLRLRVDVEEFRHKGDRIVIFHVPARPIGMPIQYRGTYWMRVGESLVPMTAEQIKRILDEGQPDFSSEICSKIALQDLEPAAIVRFRELWYRKSNVENLLHVSDEQLLLDAGLLTEEGVTFAALVLLGSQRVLDRRLAQAEVVFEYRSGEASIPFQQRVEYRQAFFMFFDDLWKTINLRNDLQHFQHGPFIFDIPTLNEQVVREALLNAVSHRDYRLAGSVFVRQFPTKLEVISPGGLPEGITPDNILDKQYPRNRLIADNLVRCGLVERSGQGFDKIVSQTIREAKPLPDFAGTDAYQVYLTLHGIVRDPDFLRFLEKISAETHRLFPVRDLIILDLIHNGQRIPEHLTPRLPALLDAGVIEVNRRGRETEYILAKRFYALADKRGIYTSRKGLDKEQNKALIMKHLENYGRGTFHEFQQVLPALTPNQITGLLRELRRAGGIVFEGAPRYGYWRRKI